MKSGVFDVVVLLEIEMAQTVVVVVLLELLRIHRAQDACEKNCLCEDTHVKESNFHDDPQPDLLCLGRRVPISAHSGLKGRVVVLRFI